MSLYDVPDKVKFKFNPEMNSGLTTNFFYRIIWVSISIGHIRDQYFTGAVWDLVNELEKEWPLRLDDFLLKIRLSSLTQYGRSYRSSGYHTYSVMDINWWTKVWERLYYKKDIELDYVGEDKC